MKKIKSLIYLTTLLFCTPYFVLGQSSDTDSLSNESLDSLVVQDTLDRNSLLWEVSGNGLEKSSYVFGTIHMIDKQDFLFTEVMEEAFEASDLITFEIKLDDMNSMASQMSMMMKAFMEGGTTLRDLVSKEDYQLIEDHFSKIGLPLVLLERMKPMFLSALASGDVSPDKMASGEIVSYEFELMDKAKVQSKPIGGLETIEFQMGLFDQIPYKAQAQMLVDGIKNSDASQDQFKEMVELYKRQDLEAMQQMVSSDEEGFGEYEDILLVKRNEAWIPLMVKSMAKQPTFFAVGAGHLAGDKGVIRLLEAAGYTLTPLK